MPWAWQKGKGAVHPKSSKTSSAVSLSPSQLNAVIMDMLNVQPAPNNCQNSCRGSILNLSLQQTTKLKTCANSKHLQMTNQRCLKWMRFFFDKVENFVGKGENACYQHFLLFPQCCQRASLPKSLNCWIVWFICLFRVLRLINCISVFKRRQFINPCFLDYY